MGAFGLLRVEDASLLRTRGAMNTRHNERSFQEFSVFELSYLRDQVLCVWGHFRGEMEVNVLDAPVGTWYGICI